MSGPCSVNWYRLRLAIPPMRTRGGFCRYVRIPGIAFSFGRSPSITCSGVRMRSVRGFNRMLKRPALPLPPKPDPILEEYAATFGSAAITAATCRCILVMPSNEISCGASVDPESVPVSWLGMNPFGTNP